jgi:hypothetical protein
MSFQLREEWLNAMASRLAPWFEAQNHPLPRYRVSCGFPSTGKGTKRIGECWSDSASADATHEIFIHPIESDSMAVAAILAHELIHAAVGLSHKHAGAFKQLALAIGLNGPMKATTAGEAFIAMLDPIIADMGSYPHASLSSEGNSSKAPKQGTRMLKIKCTQCLWVARTTKQWIDYGLPSCSCGGDIIPATD